MPLPPFWLLPTSINYPKIASRSFPYLNDQKASKVTAASCFLRASPCPSRLPLPFLSTPAPSSVSSCCILYHSSTLVVPSYPPRPFSPSIYHGPPINTSRPRASPSVNLCKYAHIHACPAYHVLHHSSPHNACPVHCFLLRGCRYSCSLCFCFFSRFLSSLSSIFPR